MLALPLPALIAIFYWGLYRPAVLSFSFTFLLGLLQDLLTGLPFGLSALLYLGVRGLVVSSRRYVPHDTFWLAWAIFSLIAFLYAIALWIMLALWFAEPAPFRIVLLQALATIAFYPLLHGCFNRLYTMKPLPVL